MFRLLTLTCLCFAALSQTTSAVDGPVVTNYGLKKLGGDWHLLIRGYQPAGGFQINATGSGEKQKYRILAATGAVSSGLRTISRPVDVTLDGDFGVVYVEDENGTFKVRARDTGEDGTVESLEDIGGAGVSKWAQVEKLFRSLPEGMKTDISGAKEGTAVIWHSSFGDRLLIWNGTADSDKLERRGFTATRLSRNGVSEDDTFKVTGLPDITGWESSVYPNPGGQVEATDAGLKLEVEQNSVVQGFVISKLPADEGDSEPDEEDTTEGAGAPDADAASEGEEEPEAADASEEAVEPEEADASEGAVEPAGDSITIPAQD